MSDGTLQESCIDQILTTNTAMVSDVQTVSSIGKSDHLGIICNLKVKNDSGYFRSTKSNWSKFDSCEMSAKANDINWCYSKDNLSVEHMWEELYGKLKIMLDLVPTTTVKFTKKGEILTKLPWDCTALKRKRKEQDAAWAIFDESPTAFNLNVALYKQSAYDKKQSQVMIKYEKRIVSNMKTNPKKFFAYLKSKRKIKHTVTALKMVMVV